MYYLLDWWVPHFKTSRNDTSKRTEEAVKTKLVELGFNKQWVFRGPHMVIVEDLSTAEAIIRAAEEVLERVDEACASEAHFTILAARNRNRLTNTVYMVMEGENDDLELAWAYTTKAEW